MATIVAVVAASALDFGTAATVAATVGASLLDSYLIPHIFPQDLPKNPLPLPTINQEEGAGCNYPIGDDVRIPGQVIWTGPFRPKSHTSAKIATFLVDIAVAFAKFPASESATGVTRVLGTSDEIWVNDASVNIDTGLTNQIWVRRPAFIDKNALWWWQIVRSEPGSFDLTKFETGVPLTETGWAQDLNNVPGTESKTGKVVRSERVSDGRTELTVDIQRSKPGVSGDVRVAAGVGPDRKIVQVAPNIRKNRISGLTVATDIKLGTGTQTKHAKIEEVSDPAGDGHSFHRHTGYVLLRDLILIDWANRPPQFELLVNGTGTTTVAQAIDKILGRSVLPSSQWNTTALTGLSFTGYNIVGLEAPAKSLEPLLLAYDILTQWRKGVLYFFPRNSAEEVLVDVDDLGSYEAGTSQRDVPLRVSSTQPEKLPTEVTVTYIDKDEDHAGATATARVISPLARVGATTMTSPFVENKQTVDIPLALSQSEARQIAERLLWGMWANRHRVSGTLPYKYMHLLENDVLTFDESIYGQNWRVLLNRVTKGVNGVIEFEGVSEDLGANIQTASWTNPKLTFKSRTKLVAYSSNTFLGMNIPRP